MIAAPALAGVWVAQSSYGPTCYLLSNGLIGTGVVNISGSTTKFTGFLKATPNPVTGYYNYSTYSGSAYAYAWTYPRLYDCSNAGASQPTCVSQYARPLNYYSGSYGAAYYNGYDSPLSTVYVKDLTITLAQPTACW